jgi:hypothetical protein
MKHKKDGRFPQLRIQPGAPIIRPSVTGCDRQDAYVQESLRQCPLYEPDDRLGEAHYFLAGMLQEYHNPDEFRWNLNAFLQALRNVTFVLQKTLSSSDGFDSWWPKKQTEMRQDLMLRAFVEGRNIVVKEGNLTVSSRAMLGLFRNHRSKLTLAANNVPCYIPSRVLLSSYAPKLGLIDDEHSAIGEEYGVERDWFVSELGEGNVVDLCNKALTRISDVLDDAHDFAGIGTVEGEPPQHSLEHVRVLTESDVDSELPKKWGWL